MVDLIGLLACSNGGVAVCVAGAGSHQIMQVSTVAGAMRECPRQGRAHHRRFLRNRRGAYCEIRPVRSYISIS